MPKNAMPKGGPKQAPIGDSHDTDMGGKPGGADALHSAGHTKPTFQHDRMKKVAKMGSHKK